MSRDRGMETLSVSHIHRKNISLIEHSTTYLRKNIDCQIFNVFCSYLRFLSCTFNRTISSSALCLSPNLSFVPFIFRIDMKWTYKSLIIFLLGIFLRCYILAYHTLKGLYNHRKRKTCSVEISESNRKSSSRYQKHKTRCLIIFTYVIIQLLQYFQILVLPK